MFALDEHRDPRHHQDHQVRHLGQALVEPAGLIPKLPGQGIVRHNPPPHFIADQDGGGGGLGQCLQQIFAGRLDAACA